MCAQCTRDRTGIVPLSEGVGRQSRLSGAGKSAFYTLHTRVFVLAGTRLICGVVVRGYRLQIAPAFPLLISVMTVFTLVRNIFVCVCLVSDNGA